MDPDLKPFLDSWPYDPDDCVRVIALANGREVIQVRLPLGIEQYELDGRPDGSHPHGAESSLDHYLARLEEAKTSGSEVGFRLDSDECVELFNEGVLYYYRYLHLFQLKDWPRTVRDTLRNLKLFDFVHKYAKRGEDRHQVLDGRDAGAGGIADDRAELGADHRFGARGDAVVAGEVGAHEADPGVRRGRPNGAAHNLARMQADAGKNRRARQRVLMVRLCRHDQLSRRFQRIGWGQQSGNTSSISECCGL